MADGRTIYLHIGTEKTGTTTLQAMFSANRRVLAQSGILYPTVPGNANLVGLAVYALPIANRPDLYSALRLTTPTEVEAYRDSFTAELSAEIDQSGCRDIVISSEHLSSRLKQEHVIGRLFEMLNKLADTIKVIVYLRPQHELAPSFYSTSVKSGNSKPFCAPLSDSEYFYNYDLLTRNWERHVGRSNMIVRLFSRSVFKENSLVADIFDAMCLHQPVDLVIPEEKNTALAADVLEFMRMANALVPRRLGRRVNPEQIALLKLLNGLEQTRKFEIDRETTLAIETMFLASNGVVAERYFPASGGRLFPPARSPEHPASPPTPEDLVRIGVEVWRRSRGDGRPALAAGVPAQGNGRVDRHPSPVV